MTPGSRASLGLPDDEFVTIELVSSASGRQDVDLGKGLSHIAIQEKLDGSPVDWMEHVKDEQYQG